jgi:hypothetical protein
MKMIEFGPWYGELGWEVMTFAPACRRIARSYDKAIVTSFPGMGPLYDDFAEFQSHGKTGRSLIYDKHYRVDGDHRRYGDADKAIYKCDILLHARGISRKRPINYRCWDELVKLLAAHPWSVGWIGSKEDYFFDYDLDLRDLTLQQLMNQMAAARVVVGVSSGVMHLAAGCGADLLVWGDKRTYFGETLEERYKKTWNPHKVRVGYIAAEDWQPSPIEILEEITGIMHEDITA